MKTEDKPLVIVLSRNYSTGLSIIRSLGAAGYTVDLIASSYKKGASIIAASSKYVRRSVEVVSRKKALYGKTSEFLNEILTYAGTTEQKPVLFPTDDYTTALIDLNRSTLEPHFAMPTIVGGGDGCLTQHMDKVLQAELARNANLNTPLEWIIPLNQTLDIPEDIVYPCFCKPIESVSGYKTEMAVCKSRKELREHLKRLKAKKSQRSILIQEYLKIDSEIDLSGVCLDQEIIIPAFIKKLNIAKYERGVTLAGKLVSTDEFGDLLEKIIDMMKKFHYVGMFDMEFNIVGDKIYFNEVNLRSGGPNFSYFMSGVNLPALFVKEILGQKHSKEEETLTTCGKTFVYEKVAWEDYLHGYMSKNSLDRRIELADIRLLEYKEDPLPGKLFKKRMKLSYYKKKLRKIINKKKLRRFVRILKRKARPLLNRLRKMKYFLLGYPQSRKSNRRNPYADKPRVIVAGRNYCSNLCMARSLGQAGYEVEVLRIFQTKPAFHNLLRQIKPDAYSKYVKAYHICISNRQNQRIVAKLIRMSDKYRKMLLIPTDDLVANIADQYYNKLSAYYLLPNISHKSGEITRLMSKNIQKELAISLGLPVLNSCVIQVKKGGAVNIPETVTYPCFIKPNISKNSSKSRMCKCENEQELLDTLTNFSKRKSIEMLVEDYVEIDKELSLLGLSTSDGAIAPGYFQAEAGGHAQRRGVALVGKMLPCSREQKLISDILHFVESLNFEGLFDVDLIRTIDGSLYFVELNLRYGASGYAVTECGANLPGMFADYMYFGTPIPLDCQINATGKQFISERIMLEEYINGFISKDELDAWMKEVDIHFIKNDMDKGPYRHFRKFYPLARAKRYWISRKSQKIS